MARRHTTTTPLAAGAALAWGNLGLRWLEMMAASGQTIAHRTRRRPTPARLYGMGSEKAMAAFESGQAMARQMMDFPAGNALAMWDAWARVLGAGMAPYHARAVRNARAPRRR